MITGLNHANISTVKLEETRAFFVDVLGLKMGPRPDFPFAGAWLYVGDQAVLHIVERNKARTPDGALDHFSLTVGDFDAALAQLDSAGVPYVAQDIPDGFGRQAFLKDPNGVTVELTWTGR
ncbi:MAG: VOC family protein [Alphaproteobacteria bacterium]|nr:VOC family protein [Alphaproteobacteria bacterium]